MECLDVIISTFATCLPALRQSLADELVSTTKPSQKSKNAVESRFKRTVIWSHHLLATSKRRSILAWSKELHLGGYSRPGYPGAIFAEGEEEDVDEFVRRLKELRWQALQVRDEMVVEGRACGNGDGGIIEVEGLSEVADGLREKGNGLAEMFLEGLRIGTG